MNRTTEIVTPETARAWLDAPHNPPNRPMVRGTIKYLVSAARSNRWAPAPDEGVWLGLFGILLDGQHILTAICELGVPMPVTVFRDETLTAADMERFDRGGRVRCAADIASMRGSTNVVVMVAAIRHAYAAFHAVNGWDKLRNDEVLPWAERFGMMDRFQSAACTAARFRLATQVTRSAASVALCALCCEATGVDIEQLARWEEGNPTPSLTAYQRRMLSPVQWSIRQGSSVDRTIAKAEMLLRCLKDPYKSKCEIPAWENKASTLTRAWNTMLGVATRKRDGR